MILRYGSDYLERLYSTGTVHELWSELTTIEGHCALPQGSWLFCRIVEWVSTTRSGVWTYYESTPSSVQQRISDTLQSVPDLADTAAYYNLGMRIWKEEDKIGQIDDWIDRNESVIEVRVLRLARSEQMLIEQWNASPRA